MASTQWGIGGAWMALHLWEHYRFTLNKDFLAEWYPVLKEHALFFLDFLKDDGSGFLVTAPSLSPENRYVMDDGFDTPICAGPTMDNQVIRTLFGACVDAAEILGLDDPLTPEFAAAKARLPENKIGSRGQLLEWREEVTEMSPGMGHISHLWGSYPGDEINWKDTPEFLKAVGRSLELRREHGATQRGGGWPMAWFICQFARLGDREKTGDGIRRMASSSGTRNFFNGSTVFQIDGNLGATAGIAEALIQSHTGILELLPALPPEWKSGSATGLCARGGHKVDMVWQDGVLIEAMVTAGSGPLEIRGEMPAVTCDGVAVETWKTEHGFSLRAQAGKTYRILA
jgi:alpha-L-fucosidase 2